jgi:hypothetical protein
LKNVFDDLTFTSPVIRCKWVKLLNDFPIITISMATPANIVQILDFSTTGSGTNAAAIIKEIWNPVKE